MTPINEKILDKVKELYYKEQFSVQEVANKLNVSIDAVFYCMKKNGLIRRKIHESNNINFERSALSFKIRKLDTEKLRTLKVIGIMLYWGEGGKSDKAMTVDFANSDKHIIILFLRFLREICGVDEKRLRVSPYFYANQNIRKNIDFWSKVTKISKKQFTKPYIRKDFDIEKKHRMPHGLIHIRYADKRLLRLLKNWINEYKNF